MILISSILFFGSGAMVARVFISVLDPDSLIPDPDPAFSWLPIQIRIHAFDVYDEIIAEQKM